MIAEFLVLDIRTMMVILFLGNLLASLVIYVYWMSHKDRVNTRLVVYVIAARLLLAISFFMIVMRSQIPDILSVNIANTFLLLGFLFESFSMLRISKNDTKQTIIELLVIAAASIILFNVAEFTVSTESLRVTFASIGVFVVMVIPSIKLMFTKDASFFKRFSGFLYCFFTALLLPRAVYTAQYVETDIFSDFLIQSLTFLALVMILVFSLAVFLLLMKEESDERILSMAETDSLSGLSNRQSFVANAVKQIDRHRREEISFCILFIDIDYFKNVNDTYGHGFGDEVIKKTAECMRKSIRSNDLSSRFGGEEFTIMALNADLDTGYVISDRLHSEIADLRFEEYEDFRFTISIGMTLVKPNETGEVMDYIDRADKALYQAKQTGRNKTVVC